ncbi:MAG: rcc01693 family protein [Allorhizobium sp.]
MTAAGGESAGNAAPGPFPWGAAMHAGLCLLRLDPAIFWALSPREFAAMTGALAPRPARLGRVRLEALMRRFPDEERTKR